jgi:hypothetical protein
MAGLAPEDILEVLVQRQNLCPCTDSNSSSHVVETIVFALPMIIQNKNQISSKYASLVQRWKMQAYDIYSNPLCTKNVCKDFVNCPLLKLMLNDVLETIY